MGNIVLASKSPRRKELLELLGVEFTIIPAIKDEVITKNAPEEVVQELALEKAQEVYDGLEMKEDALVIGSDTIVCCDGEIMGKPVDEADAFRMIEKLQGNAHSVFTGVALLWKKDGAFGQNVFFEETKVEIYPMDEDEILGYIQTGEPMDKAGAYGMQGGFAPFVKGIHGEYANVVGLPIGRLYQEMKRVK
ncbi:MAG: Maf family protein [Eubacteriales bacterium]